MNILITGVAGVLGSSLANMLSCKYYVRGLDIVRREEAWRLNSDIDYVWKSAVDIDSNDVAGIDLVFDCSIAVADRPLGTSSPEYTLLGNLLPSLKLLHTLSKYNREAIVVYPSSFNALYGASDVINEYTPVAPVTVYGWTKAAAELLYKAYSAMYGLRTVITRVSSAYGPKMRSDELVAKIILHALYSKDFTLRSPLAKRLWTYSGDIMLFYSKLIDNIDKCINRTLICAGNRDNRIVSNIELAKLITELCDSNINIIEGEYEAGELVDGKPVCFSMDASATRRLLDYSPQYTLEEGLRETIQWFKANLWRYKL